MVGAGLKFNVVTRRNWKIVLTMHIENPRRVEQPQSAKVHPVDFLFVQVFRRIVSAVHYASAAQGQ